MEKGLDMRVANRTKKVSLYTTWYEFKRDLEKKLGYMLLNWQWLEAKPKVPLPWDDSQMQAVSSVLVRFGEQKAIRKRNKKNKPLNVGKKTLKLNPVTLPSLVCKR